MSENKIDYVRKFRNGFSFNVIPIRNDKKAIADSEYSKWFSEVYDNPIDTKNIGVVLGRTSNNLVCFDIDAHELYSYLKHWENRTLIVKSGKKGYHVYFRLMELPKFNNANMIKDGKTIEFFAQKRLMVLPPSFIEDESIQPYGIISDIEPKSISRIEFEGIFQKLKDDGFKIELGGQTENNLRIEKAKKSTNDLKSEDWPEGCRYPNGRDLALRRFHEGWDYDRVQQEALKKNGTLSNPADYDHVIEWVDAGQSIFEKNQEENNSFFKSTEEFQKQKIKSNTDEKDVIDNTALEIMKNQKFITLRKSEETLTHNGKIYSKDDAESIIKEETEKIIFNCSTHERNEVVNKIKVLTYVNIEEFDKDPKLITLENGILDLEILQLKEHTPEHLSRVLLPVQYNNPKYEIKENTIFADIEENLKDTLFWKFLKSSFTVDGIFRKKDFETILEMMASVFVKRQIDDKAFMNLGKGENGKSVLLEYVESFLGKDNVSRIPLQDITEDRFMCAELDGKSANIFTDLEQYELRRTGKIKAITSGEGIQVQKKHQHPFELYPFCKLMFSCNRFPKVYDQTQGFFRRWIIIQWERNFENDSQRNEHLEEKLMSNQDEKNLVFSCLIHLSRNLNQNGRFTHSKDWKTIQQEWNANADSIDDFVNNYIIDSESNTSVRETYHFYKDVMLEKSETPLTIGRFGKSFAEYYDQDRVKESGKTERVWLNIALKRSVQTSMEHYDHA